SKVVRKRRVISLTNPSSTRSAGREDQRLLYTELKLTKVCVDNHLSRTYPSRGHPGPGSFAKEDTMSRLGITTFPRAGPGFSPANPSRRRFVGITAGAAGGVLGSGLWTPARSERDDDERDRGEHRASCPEQNPIPHVNQAAGPQTFGSFHFF